MQGCHWILQCQNLHWSSLRSRLRCSLPVEELHLMQSTRWTVWELGHVPIPLMLLPYFWCTTRNSQLGIHCIVGTKSAFLHVCIFVIRIWAFLDQTACEQGRRKDGIALLVEESMLIGSNMLWFQQDIGHNNALPFCRHYGVLCSWVQSKELVVRRDQVSIFQLVLILATYFWTR